MKRLFKLCITRIDWDTIEDGVPVEVNLPTSINSYVIEHDEDELPGELVVDTLTEEYGWCINSVSFTIVSISVPMTNEQKQRYIDKTYTEEDYIECFKALLPYDWRITYYPDTPEDQYPCKLIVIVGTALMEQDELSREYAEDILRETI